MTSGEPSPAVQRLLTAAGWSPRGVDEAQVGEWITWLRDQGYPPIDAAIAALTTYGGLVVEVGGFGINSWRESFDLDPRKTGLEIDRVSDWARDLGMPLAPLGIGDHGNYLIVIGQDGRVFAVGMGIAVIGADIDDAIENLVLGRRGARAGGTEPEPPNLRDGGLTPTA